MLTRNTRQFQLIRARRLDSLICSQEHSSEPQMRDQIDPNWIVFHLTFESPQALCVAVRMGGRIKAGIDFSSPACPPPIFEGFLISSCFVMDRHNCNRLKCLPGPIFVFLHRAGNFTSRGKELSAHGSISSSGMVQRFPAALVSTRN